MPQASPCPRCELRPPSSLLGTAFREVSPSTEKAAAKAEEKCCFQSLIQSFLPDFSTPGLSLEVLFYLTAKFCLDLRLFLLPLQIILFYLFIYFQQVSPESK